MTMWFSEGLKIKKWIKKLFKCNIDSNNNIIMMKIQWPRNEGKRQGLRFQLKMQASYDPVFNCWYHFIIMKIWTQLRTKISDANSPRNPLKIYSSFTLSINRILINMFLLFCSSWQNDWRFARKNRNHMSLKLTINS